MTSLKDLIKFGDSAPYKKYIKFTVLSKKERQSEDHKHQYGISDGENVIQLYTKQNLKQDDAYLLIQYRVITSKVGTNYITTDSRARFTPISIKTNNSLKQQAKSLLFPTAPNRSIIDAKKYTEMSALTGTITQEYQTEQVKNKQDQLLQIKKIKLTDSTDSSVITFWRPTQDWLNNIKIGQYVCIQNLKAAPYQNEISFNSTANTTIEIAESQPEILTGLAKAYDCEEGVLDMEIEDEIKEFLFKADADKMNQLILKKKPITIEIKENTIIKINECEPKLKTN